MNPISWFDDREWIREIMRLLHEEQLLIRRFYGLFTAWIAPDFSAPITHDIPHHRWLCRRVITGWVFTRIFRRDFI